MLVFSFWSFPQIPTEDVLLHVPEHHFFCFPFYWIFKDISARGCDVTSRCAAASRDKPTAEWADCSSETVDHCCCCCCCCECKVVVIGKMLSVMCKVTKLFALLVTSSLLSITLSSVGDGVSRHSVSENSGFEISNSSSALLHCQELGGNIMGTLFSSKFNELWREILSFQFTLFLIRTSNREGYYWAKYHM